MRADIDIFTPGMKVLSLSVETDEWRCLTPTMINIIAFLSVHGHACYLPKPPTRRQPHPIPHHPVSEVARAFPHLPSAHTEQSLSILSRCL